MTNKMRCELVSWDYFYALSLDLAFKISDSGYKPDVLIAIARGGVIPGRVLCDFLNMMEFGCFRVEHYHGAHKKTFARIKTPLSVNVDNKRLLVVDDISDSGDTFSIAMEHILQRGKPVEIKTATLQHKTVSQFVPDFYAQIITEWRWVIYPWAVHEDVGGFIEAMQPTPDSIDDISQQLFEDYDIKMPYHHLLNILKLKHHPLSQE